jgi:hypothetical protein
VNLASIDSGPVILTGAIHNIQKIMIPSYR